MSWETVHFTREELYRLVWERPVQDVAKRIGVSGVALGKTRRRLGVPVPGRGYWARKAAGQTLRQLPLPAPKPRQPLHYTLSRWGGFPKSEGILDSEKPMPKPEPINVADELTDPHPLVVISLPFLRQAKELRENLLERETCFSDESGGIRGEFERELRDYRLRLERLSDKYDRFSVHKGYEFDPDVFYCLVRYQIHEVPFSKVTAGLPANTNSNSMAESVKRLAKFIYLTLRPASKGGRPASRGRRSQRKKPLRISS